jgi:hypothetical protein
MAGMRTDAQNRVAAGRGIRNGGRRRRPLARYKSGFPASRLCSRDLRMRASLPRLRNMSSLRRLATDGTWRGASLGRLKRRAGLKSASSNPLPSAYDLLADD